jgi:tetratricopeptide (TPR) repeat protein
MHLRSVYLSRGHAYFKNHNVVQAIAEYTKAIEVNPKDAQAYYDRGLNYELQENYAQAIADFTKATGIDSKFGMAYYIRGLAYFFEYKHDYVKAFEDFHTAVKLGVHVDPDIIYLLKQYLAKINKSL